MSSASWRREFKPSHQCFGRDERWRSSGLTRRKLTRTTRQISTAHTQGLPRVTAPPPLQESEEMTPAQELGGERKTKRQMARLGLAYSNHMPDVSGFTPALRRSLKPFFSEFLRRILNPRQRKGRSHEPPLPSLALSDVHRTAPHLRVGIRLQREAPRPHRPPPLLGARHEATTQRNVVAQP